MKILRVLFLANAAIAGLMLLNSCKGVPEDMPPISGLQAYVKASNTGAADEFGFAVALSGDGNTLAVGAPGEASVATGIGGNQADNTAPSAGAVYVFTRSGTTWTQQAYIKASNAEAGDQFGTSVALSSDGNTLAVGAIGEDSARTGVIAGIVNETTAGNAAPGAGAVYVFTRIAGTWSQQAYVKASNTGAADNFGSSVALSGDGSTLAVGAIGEDNVAAEAGAVYVFTRDLGGVWSQLASVIRASNAGALDLFGFSVALSGDSNTLAVGAIGEASGGIEADNSAPSAGAVYVYLRSGTTWTQEAYVKASNPGTGDQFGFSVALSDNGNTLAVGATGEGSALTGVTPGIVAETTADNAAPGAGAVYVLTRSAGIWSQQAYVKASNTGAVDLFGASVSLSGDGNILAVGAIGESSAAVGIGGNQADNSAADAGAVYVYTRSGTAWMQQAYVKASNTGAGDHFGTSAALSSDGTTLAVGATGEDSSVTGINGNQADNSAPGAGAVYVAVGS